MLCIRRVSFSMHTLLRGNWHGGGIWKFHYLETNNAFYKKSIMDCLLLVCSGRASHCIRRQSVVRAPASRSKLHFACLLIDVVFAKRSGISESGIRTFPKPSVPAAERRLGSRFWKTNAVVKHFLQQMVFRVLIISGLSTRCKKTISKRSKQTPLNGFQPIRPQLSPVGLPEYWERNLRLVPLPLLEMGNDYFLVFAESTPRSSFRGLPTNQKLSTRLPKIIIERVEIFPKLFTKIVFFDFGSKLLFNSNWYKIDSLWSYL